MGRIAIVQWVVTHRDIDGAVKLSNGKTIWSLPYYSSNEEEVKAHANEMFENFIGTLQGAVDGDTPRLVMEEQMWMRIEECWESINVLAEENL